MEGTINRAQNRNVNNQNINPQERQSAPNVNNQNQPDRNFNFFNFAQLYNLENIPSREKFLFFFKLDNLANQFCCGCSLRVGVQIISIIFLAAAMSNFFTAFSHFGVFKIISSIIMFSVYFIAGYCLIYSSIKLLPDYAYYGYLIYSIIFYFIFIDNLLLLFFILIGIYDPFGPSDRLLKGFILLIVLAIMLGLHLYFLWVCYSFWIHLKNGNFELIKGNFFRSYQDYENLNRRDENPANNNINPANNNINPANNIQIPTNNNLNPSNNNLNPSNNIPNPDGRILDN